MSKGEAFIDVQINVHAPLSQVIEAEAMKVNAGLITVKQFIDWLEAADRTIHKVLDGYGGK